MIFLKIEGREILRPKFEARKSVRDAKDVTEILCSRCGSGLGEKSFHAAQSFVDALHTGGVREAQISGRAERVTGHDGDVRFFEQLLRKCGRVCGAAGPAEMF